MLLVSCNRKAEDLSLIRLAAGNDSDHNLALFGTEHNRIGLSIASHIGDNC